MRIGTTSFAFRYLLLDPARAPAPATLVELTAAAGLQVLQICENARPLTFMGEDWRGVLRRAAAAGIEIQLGCKTTDLNVFHRYAGRAAMLPSKFLRVVLEEEEGQAPSRADVERFLAGAWPLIDAAGIKVAIENHFDVPSRVLAEAVAPYPPTRIGFCVDTANSLRNFESPETVLDLLGSRAFCYHLKDFRVDGDKLGFHVTGAPLGEGYLDLDGILARLVAHDRDILVENWTPATGDWESDVRADEEWLRRSTTELRARLQSRGVAA